MAGTVVTITVKTYWYYVKRCGNIQPRVVGYKAQKDGVVML